MSRDKQGYSDTEPRVEYPRPPLEDPLLGERPRDDPLCPAREGGAEPRDIPEPLLPLDTH